MISIQNLSFSYKKNRALEDLSLTIDQGEIFGLLGPNGSGKTTLFRILSTMLEHQSGEVVIDGTDLKEFPAEVRKKIGVVFQSASLDGKLTVKENICYQGALYGLNAKDTLARMNTLLAQFDLSDRLKEKAEKLSGGLKRRVELVKALLHQPKILILDEPSTGLDPAARYDFWNSIEKLVSQEKITVLVTTHLMDEAEKCDRLAVLDQGKKICLGTPEELKKAVQKEVLIIKTRDAQYSSRQISEKMGFETKVVNGELQMEHDHAAEMVPKLVEAFPGEIESVIYRKPTLEDVFMHHTGHPFWSKGEAIL